MSDDGHRLFTQRDTMSWCRLCDRPQMCNVVGFGPPQSPSRWSVFVCGHKAAESWDQIDGDGDENAWDYRVTWIE